MKAALFPPADAAQIWTALTPSIHLDDLDWETTQLLPMVYRNLEPTGVLGAMAPRLKGLYRRTWFINQKLFGALGQVLRVLGDSGVPTLLLKGMAMIETHYRDRGVRATSDIDLMVPADQARRAADALARHSWNCLDEDFIRFYGSELTPELIRLFHGFPLTPPESLVECDLHWHLDKELVISDAVFKGIDVVWSRAVPITIDGSSTSVMDPADAFVHACIHGTKRELDTRRIRWVADAYTLASSIENGPDWDRVVESATVMRSVLGVRDVCVYLSERLGAPIPKEVTRALSRVSVRVQDRILYRARGREIPSTRLGTAERILSEHARSHQDQNMLAFLWGVPDVLLDRWGLTSRAQIPLRAAKTLYRAARGTSRL